nr:auxin-responsive protein SAUR71-like [Ipomoea batatas]GMC87235.1 auxin-responsive protein SAUR71-like [Ipomoea batatas]GME20754.1 auxin-responsive protein SAUR71-like [Ipomoea batatas]
MGLIALSMGKKQREKSCAYKKLSGGGGGRPGVCRKGYVPVMVGPSEEEEEEEERERIMIPMKLMMHPCIINLLESSAVELGYDQPGTLRIQCDVQGFKALLDSISPRRR